MKTLVVVSALVSLAIAAPTLPEDVTESKVTTLNWPIQGQSSSLDSLTKERTPSEITPVTFLNNEAPNTDFQTVLSNDGTSMPMARSFLVKKPLIVKKKYGYQLFRDSEEEKAQADPNETCGRQVKVKLCDENEKYRASMGSTHGNVDLHSTDDDVKHSIKMAKEAVENLQKDLKKMEMKTEMKTAQDSQSEIELYEDIEVARRALKHIHDNFENLETMSLRATTTRNSEDMHDVHLTIAKTEEERMAQWKEALDNIQKNVELARNIEDSFKTANNQEDFVHLDQSNVDSTITNRMMDETALLPEADKLRLTNVENLEVHNQERTTQEEKTLENTDEEMARTLQNNADDDMSFAPSEMIEVHLDHKKHHEPLTSESHKINEHEKSAEFKLEEPKTIVEDKDLLNLQQTEDTHTQEKTVEVNTETVENLPTNFFSTDDNMKPLTLVPFSEERRTEELDENVPKNATKTENEHGKIEKTDSVDVSEYVLRSALNTDEQNTNNEQMVAKDVEDLNPEQKELLVENWDLKLKQALPSPLTEMKHFDTIPKSEETLENTHFLMRENEHTEREKFIQDQLRQQWMQREELNQMETLQAMRAAEDHRLQNQKTILWPEAPNMQREQSNQMETLQAMRAAEDHRLQNQKTILWPERPKMQHEQSNQMETLQAMRAADDHRLQNQKTIVWPEAPKMQREQSNQMETLQAMRAAEDHRLQNQKTIFWPQGHKHFEHMPSMKAAVAEDFDQFENTHEELEQGFIPERTMDQFRHSYTPEHSHLEHNHMPVKDHMVSSHDSDMGHSHHHSHLPSRHHHNSMAHPHMHEMTGMDSAMHPHFLPHMRDAMEGFESEHMFQWQPTHEFARTAYGSGLSSSVSPSGAVGVFPNANVGGCGIPLLLSCSPSVVSGSLAKAHSAGPSSYSAPSYRMEDDFNFLTKRGINMNDMRTTNTMRTMTTALKQKTPMTLENKA